MNFTIGNLPPLKDEADRAVFRSRVFSTVRNSVQDMVKKRYPKHSVPVTVAEVSSDTKKDIKLPPEKEESHEDTPVFRLETPKFTLEQVVLEYDVIEEINAVINFETIRKKVFDDWGLSTIEKSPKQALNFWGESGTGKTMAAEALANKMGKKIIFCSYADIESKYFGEGPKNVRKLFEFATENEAVLFIDEADSLLSQRVNATQGAEQAANSTRSQLLIEIEKFSGIVIFATNLARNYDGAFLTRIKSIQFNLPGKDLRRKLWEKMLLGTGIKLPLDEINLDELAEIGEKEASGRDIRNAVVKSAIKAAIAGSETITQQLLADTLNGILESNRKITGKLSPQEKKEIEGKIREQLKNEKG